MHFQCKKMKACRLISYNLLALESNFRPAMCRWNHKVSQKLLKAPKQRAVTDCLIHWKKNASTWSLQTQTKYETLLLQLPSPTFHNPFTQPFTLLLPTSRRSSPFPLPLWAGYSTQPAKMEEAYEVLKPTAEA